MWCTEGFATLLEVRVWCHNLAYDRRENLINSVDLEKLTDQEFEAINVDTAAYQAWIFNRFLDHEQNNIYVCSPSGVTMRLSPYALDKKHEYFGSFPDEFEDQKAIFEYLKDNYVFLDCDYWVVKPSKADDEESLPEFREVSKLLAPIEGWPLCWKLPSPDFDSDTFEKSHQEYLPRGMRVPISERQASKGGRPKLQDDAAIAYMRAFPTGSHYPLLWKDVERKIPYNKKTIIRGLSNLQPRINQDKT